MSKIAPAVRFPIPAKPPAPPEPNELFIPPALLVQIQDQEDYDGDNIVLDLSSNFAGFSSFSATGLPDALDIDEPTGEITGTLTADASQEGPAFDGIHHVAVTASGSGPEPATLYFTWVILNRDPIIVTPIPTMNDQDGDVVNHPFAQYFADGGDDSDQLTFNISGATVLPPGLTMLDPLLGVVSGTIDSNASAGGVGGVYTVEITVDDGQGGVVIDTFDWAISAIDILITPPPFMINACATTVYVVAEVEGPQLNPHVFLWEQINIPASTPPGTDEVAVFQPQPIPTLDELTMSYDQVTLGQDKTFRFWVDKGTGTEIFKDFLITGTPTAFAQDSGNSVALGAGARVDDVTDPILIAARQFDSGDVVFDITVDTSSPVDDFNLIPDISATFVWPHARGSATHDNYILGVISEIRFQKFIGGGMWTDIEVFTDMEVDEFVVLGIESGEEYRIASVYYVHGYPGVEQIFYTAFGEINADAGLAFLINDTVSSPMGAGIVFFPGGGVVRLNTIKVTEESLYGGGPIGGPVFVANVVLRLQSISESEESSASSSGMSTPAVVNLNIINANGIEIGG